MGVLITFLWLCNIGTPTPLTLGAANTVGLLSSATGVQVQNQARPLWKASQSTESEMRPQKAESAENTATVRGASSGSTRPHSSSGQSF